MEYKFKDYVKMIIAMFGQMDETDETDIKFMNQIHTLCKKHIERKSRGR